MKTIMFAVGLALVVAGCSAPNDSRADHSRHGAPPASTTPDAPAASVAPPTPPAIELRDLPLGDPPQVSYLEGKQRLITPDQTVQLPRLPTQPSGVVPFAGGHLVADSSWFEGTNGLHLVRAGEVDHGWQQTYGCSAGSPVASSDGAHVAWVTLLCPESGEEGEGHLHRADAAGSSEATWPIGAGRGSVVGFLGDEVVFNRGFIDGAWVTDFVEAKRLGSVDRVVNVSTTGTSLIGQEGDRAQLMLAEDGTVRWRADSGHLQAFSPSGARVPALTRREVLVLDSEDGSVLTTLPLPARADTVVWETEDALLAVLSRRKRSAIVRLRLDGPAERATAVRRSLPHAPAFTLLG